MPGFGFSALVLVGLTIAFPAHGSPVPSPTVREEQEIKSDYPSIVPPIWPEVTNLPTLVPIHDDALPDDDTSVYSGSLSSFPSSSPSVSAIPSDFPSNVPSDMPSMVPSDMPSMVPSDMPSMVPSDMPSDLPTIVFEAFGNVVIDDAGEDGLALEQNGLPETPAKGRTANSKKRRTQSEAKPKKRTKIVRLLRARLGLRGGGQP